MERFDNKPTAWLGHVLPVLCIAVCMPAPGYGQIAPPFSNNDISSDFGPRNPPPNAPTSFFHGGIDYAETAGTPIKSIETGEVIFVRGGGASGWRMRILGDQTNRSFFYLHMFSSTDGPGAISNGFELGFDAATNREFIKRLSDEKIFIGRNNNTNPVTPGTSVQVEEIGPVGDSGSAAGSPHLHFQLGTSAENDLDNPFVLVQSPLTNYAVNFSLPPTNGHVLTPAEISNFAIRLAVNSTSGLDLDILRVSIDGQQLTVPSDTASPKAGFRYGGAVGENPTTSVTTAAGESGVPLAAPLGGNATFRVNPISNGVDEFIIEQIDLSGISDGTHTIKVDTLDIAGVPSPSAGTSVSFDIADPLFLVEGRKLIFSERAGKTRENSGPPGFYHRA